MTYQPRFTEEFGAAPALSVPGVLAKPAVALSPLEEELALMDCAIPLSRIPTHFLDDADDHEVSGLNLFGPVMDDDGDVDGQEDSENFLREARLSPVAQSRVVALRRRRVRAQLRRPLPVWPLPGGQDDDELRNMRDRIYTVEADAKDRTPSVPLRVATHAISLTLVAAALPVGAALMTYNLLKGEDIRVTARLTTLSGLALAVIGTNPHLAQVIGA